MKINRLALRGMIGIKKGMGLDEINLDLSGLSGLIALSGPNGNGKTTVLEALHPFRTLASRKKALGAHCFLRDSYRELEFEFQGDHYKTRILIDCDNGKQEGYIWKNGESQVDEKVRNYDKYITDLFGSEELFFNSIFCAQNSAKLSDIRPGKLKELFAEFLQLDRYVTYENTVKKCLVALNAQATAYDRQLETLQEQLKGFGELEWQLTQSKDIQFLEKAALEELKKEIASITSQIVAVKEKIAANAALEDRANDFLKRINETKAAITDAELDYEGSVSGLRQSLVKYNSDIAALSALLERKEEIEQAAIRKKDLEEEASGKSRGYEAGYVQLSEVRAQISELESVIRDANRQDKDEPLIQILQERIRNTEAKTSELAKRDPECPSNICSFIKSGIDAQEALPGMRKELATVKAAMAERDRAVKAIRTETTTKIIKLKSEESIIVRSMHELKKLIEEIQAGYKTVSRLADKIGDIKAAMAHMKNTQERAEEFKKEGMAKKEKFDAKRLEMKAKLSELEESFKEINGSINPLSKEVLEELEGDLQQKNALKQELSDSIVGLETAIREAQINIERRDTYRGQKTDISAKRDRITARIAEWIYLRDAVSKDGLRAIEIASVAPSISTYANEILFKTFGPAYSVKLRTQDDEGGEVLEILALEENGKETLLDDLSGGEKVWSLKALRLAMTLISKEKSGKALMSCFADEEDGPLDAVNAINFIQLYRSFMDTGGFESCFFISHRPECVAMADHVLEFGKYGISIN